MPAVAVTDHGNLFGAIGFYERCEKAGVKPIIGCEMYISKTNRLRSGSRAAAGRHHLIVLCENEKGYSNLVKLVSRDISKAFTTSRESTKNFCRAQRRARLAYRHA